MDPLIISKTGVIFQYRRGRGGRRVTWVTCNGSLTLTGSGGASLSNNWGGFSCKALPCLLLLLLLCLVRNFAAIFGFLTSMGGRPWTGLSGFMAAASLAVGISRGGLCVWCKAGECGMDRMGLVDAALLAACSPPPHVTAENAEDGNEL